VLPEERNLIAGNRGPGIEFTCTNSLAGQACTSFSTDNLVRADATESLLDSIKQEDNWPNGREQQLWQALPRLDVA
jgi:hypothetical protein